MEGWYYDGSYRNKMACVDGINVAEHRGLLCEWNFGLRKEQGISWLAEQLLASHVGMLHGVPVCKLIQMFQFGYTRFTHQHSYDCHPSSRVCSFGLSTVSTAHKGLVLYSLVKWWSMLQNGDTDNSYPHIIWWYAMVCVEAQMIHG